MARPRLDEEERRAQTVGVRVTAAEVAELRELNRIGVNLRQTSTGRMPVLLTARSPDSPRSYRPALVQSLG